METKVNSKEYQEIEDLVLHILSRDNLIRLLKAIIKKLNLKTIVNFAKKYGLCYNCVKPKERVHIEIDGKIFISDK